MLTNDPASSKQTFFSLQILRGLAAIFVVLHHYVQMVFLGKPTGRIAAFFLEKGPASVDVFFILSGFIMAYSARNYKGEGGRFMVNRFLRVIPNYWFYTTLLLVSSAILSLSCYITRWNIHSLWCSYLLLPNANPNGFGNFPFLYVGWSLTYEMFFYLALSLALIASSRWYFHLTCFTLGSLPLVLHGYNPFGVGNLYLLEFVSGMLLLVAFERLKRVPPAATRSVLFALGVGLSIAMGSRGFDHLSRMMLSLWLVAVAIQLEPLAKRRHQAVKMLVHFGDLSYSIYLSHVVVLGWTVALLGIPRTSLQHWVAICLFLSLVWLISYATYRGIETGPLPSYLKTRLDAVFGGRRREL